MVFFVSIKEGHLFFFRRLVGSTVRFDCAEKLRCFCLFGRKIIQVPCKNSGFASMMSNLFFGEGF